jgi:hypothetical protein
MKIENFFSELKWRNVYKVAIAYAIVGWLVVQITTQVFPFLQIPDWVVRLVIVLVALGFPIALVIAWAFELTPEGIKRTENAALPAERADMLEFAPTDGGCLAMVSLADLLQGNFEAARPRPSGSGPTYCLS